MQKVIGIIIVGLLIAGGVWWLNSKRSIGENKEMMRSTSDAMMPQTENTMATKQRYVEYTPEKFEAAKGMRRVLYFYATWCPECKLSNSDFEKHVADIPADVTLIRVNYNDPDTDANEKALAKQYGITYQHSFVQIDADGKVLASWNGGGFDKLMSMIK